MYILAVAYQNARLNGTDRFSVPAGKQSVPKWTLLEAGERSRELLQLIVFSCNAPPFLYRLPCPAHALRKAADRPLQVGSLRVVHQSTDNSVSGDMKAVGGIQLDARGNIRTLVKGGAEKFFEEKALRNPLAKTNLRRDFLLAYGDELSAHEGDDDFDFTDPFFRTRRFHSLFSSGAAVTDPVAFLDRLFYRGSKHKRLPAVHALERICRLLQKHFALKVDHWLRYPGMAMEEWDGVPCKLRKPLLPMLDAVRHILDACPRVATPLDLPGVVLLDRPDRYCADALLTAWLAFFDELFPNLQFFTTIPGSKHTLIPDGLTEKGLPLPVEQKPSAGCRPSVGPVDVLLIDVDSRLPNLALMKLSQYFKQQGRKVTLARGAALIPSAREVYASCIFTARPSTRKVKVLQGYYGDSLQLGGSGIDPCLRLPVEIEALPPDYGLYPELEGRAIGFLSRGCPLHCPFCIVPVKEGPPRLVSDLETLLEGGRRKKLILLDDNLLSLPEAEDLLEEMAFRGIQVNFTQTLDLRFVNRRKAELLRRIDCSNTRFTRRNYYFSLNNDKNLPLVREKYGFFGFSSRDNVEFVCMYGFNTTLAEDVARFRFLRTLPGAYAFTQLYQAIPGGPPADTALFFEGDADSMITELISIGFTQNMKSMEKYYRWVSKNYAKSLGKLHMPLVDTIFRYNNRSRKGRYLTTLAGLKK